MLTTAKDENNLNLHQQVSSQTKVAYAYNAYYITIKKTEILIHSTTGMKLEYIILSEMLVKILCDCAYMKYQEEANS